MAAVLQFGTTEKDSDLFHEIPTVIVDLFPYLGVFSSGWFPELREKFEKERDKVTHALLSQKQQDALFAYISRLRESAKAEIWQKPEDFAAKARDFDTAAQKFNSAARGDDLAAMRASQADLGKTCKACHDSYRAEKHSQ